MRFIVTTLCVLLLLTELHAQRNNSDIEELQSTIFIQHNLIYPSEITLIDGWLFVKDLLEATGEYGIKVFEAQTGKKLYAFVRPGKGPGEYINFDMRKGPHPGELELTGSTTKKNDLYDIQCLKQKPPISEVYSCIKKTIPNMTSREAIIIQDSLVFNTGAKPHGVLYLNKGSRIISKLDKIPRRILNRYKRPMTSSLSMAGYIISNFIRTKVAFFAEHYDYFSVYSSDYDHAGFTKTAEKTFTWIPDFTVLDNGSSFAITPSENAKFAFREPTAGRNLIYVPFSGRTNDDVEVSEQIEWRAFTNRIKVYDWNGIEIKELQLTVDISKITVDNDETTLFGIHYNKEGEPAIVKASLIRE